MADFKEYLKFTDKIEYRDRQVLEISKINIDEDMQEKFSNIGSEVNLLVFAHPECPDCTYGVAVLEAIRKYVPILNIDYRKRSEDKDLLLKYSKDGKIPGVFLISGIKVRQVMSEYPDELKDKLINSDIKQEYYVGKYNDIVLESIYNKIKESE